jgi:SAM-dependent methyltransferase
MSLRMFFKRLLYPGLNLGVRSRRSLTRHFLREADSRTLDLGSGNGFFASRACRKGSSVLSVSFDADQIARCQALQPHLGCPPDRLKFEVMTAEKIDQLTEQFDQILLLEVIEHLDDDLAVLRKLAQRLKPGGIIHISTPDCWLGYWVGTLDRHATGGHARVGYSDYRLFRLVEDAGLDLAYQTRLGGIGVYLTPLQSAIAKLLGDSIFAQTLAFLIVYPPYLLVEWIPVPPSWRMFHYAIARRRRTSSQPA